MILWRIDIVAVVTLLSLVSCSSSDDGFYVSRLEGTWARVWQSDIQDAGTEQYTFYPESTYAGWAELYVSGLSGEETKELNYVVGETGHMNIYTGKKHDGKSKSFGEYDIHKLTSSEMIWYRTDSNEELARFKKVK